MREKKFSVYIMTNARNTVLYTGVTSNLVKRAYQHKHKLIEGFTSKYNISKLVYYEFYEDPELAIKREKTIKNMIRKKKDKLVTDFNPEWKDLYGDLLK